MFASRGEVTPADPLEFHLFHLARYWSRLGGFAGHVSDGCNSLIEGDLGIAVRMGTEQADRVIRDMDLIGDLWTDYVEQVETMMTLRPVSTETMERASAGFDRCLEAIGYDPWYAPSASRKESQQDAPSDGDKHPV
jgi:hypothetical protein